MRQRLREARRLESGFTLIELLIVIVILGILAAVVVIAVGAFSDRGQTAACKSDVKSVEVAVEAYRAKNGDYPSDLSQLTSPPENYLKELPNTTVDTGEYWITYGGNTGPNAGQVTGTLKGGGSCGGAAEALPTGGATQTTTGGGGGSTTPPPTSTTTQPPVAPGVPGSVNVASGNQCTDPPGSNNTTCAASWTAASGNPTPTYNWEVDTRSGGSCDSGDFTGGRVATGTTASLGVTITGLSNSGYCFRIQATNSAGTSNWVYDSFDGR